MYRTLKLSFSLLLAAEMNPGCDHMKQRWSLEVGGSWKLIPAAAVMNFLAEYRSKKLKKEKESETRL